MKQTVYIQPAPKCSQLGFIVEVEQQRELVKKIATGEETGKDSPLEQWDLHLFLNLYLFENAKQLDTLNVAEHHQSEITYETRSNGIIQLCTTMGWSEIHCNKKGAIYLENLLREKGYFVITKKEVITG